MGDWKKRFPSKYLKASDLDDGPIDATIKEIVNETIGQGDRQELKPVLYCREKGVKGVVMNLTKMEALEQIAGTSDDDDWPGLKIRFQKGRTKYQGKSVDCIDIVKPPAPATKRPSPKKRSTEPEPDDPLPTDVDDDEVPF
jgi:hypothetical protein